MRIYHLVEAESLWALSQRGSVNLPQVRELQDRLRAAGHDPGPSDGWYGQRTANAVRAYQQANNLTVDGDAGPQTLSSLGMAGAQATPAQPTTPAETPPAPAPRQPTREPAPAPTPAPRTPANQPSNEPDVSTRPGPEAEPEQTSTRTDRSGLPPFDRIESSEPVRTNEDAVSQIITLWYDSNISRTQFRTFASMAISNYIQQGIIRTSAAQLVEMDLEEWGEKAGIVSRNQLPVIEQKSMITTSKSAAGYTATQVIRQLTASTFSDSNVNRIIRQTRNELIQDGLLRESAARLHDMYVQDYIREVIRRQNESIQRLASLAGL